MSRVGEKPVDIPQGVTVKVDGKNVHAKGTKAELKFVLPAGISAAVEGGKVVIKRDGDSRMVRSYHGMSRTMIANMMIGLTKGYTIEMEIQGVGFKAAVQGRTLQLSLGFSHVAEYPIPDGVNIAVDGGVRLTLSGADKQKVGDAAARIKCFYPAEPYKGKGVRFKNEYVRRKVGKSVA